MGVSPQRISPTTTMRTRNQSFRKGRISNIDRSNRFLPFPASASTALVIILCVSTLSALFIGIHRHNHATAIDFSSGSSGNVAERHDNIVTPRDAGHADGPSIRSFQDLSPSEIHPLAVPDRHIVSPPSDKAPITLVTCRTTVGYLHILVHPSWAPLGAQRFLQMVNTKYFSSKVALMRCIKGFLCQFGLAGDPAYNKPYVGKNRLEDDPNWLPEGPSHRTNDLGVKRFAKGYLAYAGAGPNSRTNQFIIALRDNGRLGGGSPWEVPWGEIVGAESYRTLDAIYTGYGEKGPPQGRLSKEGSSEGIKNDFPKLDYILGCDVVGTQ